MSYTINLGFSIHLLYSIPVLSSYFGLQIRHEAESAMFSVYGHWVNRGFYYSRDMLFANRPRPKYKKVEAQYILQMRATNFKSISPLFRYDYHLLVAYGLNIQKQMWFSQHVSPVMFFNFFAQSLVVTVLIQFSSIFCAVCFYKSFLLVELVPRIWCSFVEEYCNLVYFFKFHFAGHQVYSRILMVSCYWTSPLR